MGIKNKYIARLFRTGAQLMELHDENQFKVRAYENAASKLRGIEQPVAELSEAELEKIDGIGKNMARKIIEIKQTGTYDEYDNLLAITPIGLLSLVKIKGLGAKKIRTLWKELNVSTPEELMAACEENKLTAIKGFGKKTQDNIIELLEFYFEGRGHYLYAEAEAEAHEIIESLKQSGITNISVTGDMRRCMPVVQTIEILALCTKETLVSAITASAGTIIVKGDEYFSAELDIPLIFHTCNEDEWVEMLFRTTGNQTHILSLSENTITGARSEEEIYANNKIPYIIPELREGRGEAEIVKELGEKGIIEVSDIKGCIHNHSTYSDGQNTLEEMANACIARGLQYFGISDHSKTAVYANGLQPKKVLAQMKEIDQLNEKLAPFKIFKGIESDILGDGSLDYEADILKLFDYVVASVHSGLKMNEEDANKRLLKAIENPYTTILGHMTARLLLMRKGYPVDHKYIIDACAANNVGIEINANPRRLDIDWHWLPYAVKKGIMLSINPDAHGIEEIDNMYFGVLMARKGGLSPDMILNCKPLAEVEAYFNSKK